jgi:hypothetical protein
MRKLEVREKEGCYFYIVRTFLHTDMCVDYFTRFIGSMKKKRRNH